MAIKPILFSTPMVQAIKAGRKKQTRRIIKGLESRYVHVGTSNEMEIPRPAIKYDDRVWHSWNYPNSNAVSIIERCPVKAGDILWVRETWLQIHKDVEFEGRFSEYVYRAEEKANEEKFGHIKNPVGKRFIDSWKWKPSIFMPKEAARIFLKVTNVRAERLHDISEDDAIAEGIEIHESCNGDDYSSYPRNYLLTEKEADGWPYLKEDEFVESFKTLWQSINGRESWDANPWVWVYEFEQIEKPEDFGNE